MKFVSKELKSFYGFLLALLVFLIAGALVFGTNHMNELINHYTDMMPAWLKVTISILAALYVMALPVANDPLYFLRKCFVRNGRIWVRDDDRKNDFKEPFFWQK